MSTERLLQIAVLLFVACFFIYLFGPLIVMGLTAFNSSAFPRVTPWECFSVEWFGVLVQDTKLMEGVRNSFLIGLGVVCLAVPTGLAGALLLTQVSPRVRPWYYTIVISPILVPGVVLGISTLIFWDRISLMFGASGDSFFYDLTHNGIFLTVIGQSTFISAYTMLVFISRLQRFNPALEEAALDLGATHLQAFRKVLLPFLKPAIASAAVLAFLASFENYNTTIFTIVSESTLTTVLASKVRYGINPSISSLAVVIVLITLFGAVFYEVLKRREIRTAAATREIAHGRGRDLVRARGILGEPGLYMLVAIFVAGIGTAYFAGTLGLDECKEAVKTEKKRITQERIEKLKAKTRSAENGPATPEKVTPKVRIDGTKSYETIFAPSNLQQSDNVSSEKSTSGSPQKKPHQNIFAPSNLLHQSSSPTQDQSATDSPSSTQPSPERDQH